MSQSKFQAYQIQPSLKRLANFQKRIESFPASYFTLRLRKFDVFAEISNILKWKS